MFFWNEGWKSLKGLKLDDFVNLEMFKLNVDIFVEDCQVDVDLSGLKHLLELECVHS